MILIPVGKGVRSGINPKIEGTVVGYGTIDNTIKYLVELREGYWNADHTSFTSVEVWDPSSCTPR